MPAPNIASPASITLKSIASTVGTSAATFVSCPADRALKVSALTVANVNGGTPADISVQIVSGGQTHSIASTISVPADATLVVVDRNSPVYLEEGESLQVFASSTGSIHACGSYEEIA